MKHNAANQSRVCDPNSPNNLIPNLDRDYASCIKGVPLMQVGIFSVMTNIFPFPLLRTGFYRMPKTYFVAKLPRVVPPLPITCCSPSCPSFVAAMAGFCNPLPSWLIPPSISGAAVSADPATGMAVVSAPVPPPPGNFSFRDAGIDYNVEGHVEFFVGIRY